MKKSPIDYLRIGNKTILYIATIRVQLGSPCTIIVEENS